MGRRVFNLKDPGPNNQVKAITHCADTYDVTAATGDTHQFWEFNLRFKNDSSGNNPGMGAPVYLEACAAIGPLSSPPAVKKSAPLSEVLMAKTAEIPLNRRSMLCAAVLAWRPGSAAKRGVPRSFRRQIAVIFALSCVVLLASSLGDLYFGPTWAHEAVPLSPASQAINRGPFSLVDHRGEAVTDKDFLGKFMLVYFGYTHCRDLCPIDLQIMTQAIGLLGEQGEKVQPVFITVDSKRDTVEIMADYVARFHPRLFGLTGTREQVDEAASTYRVRRMKFFPLNLDDGDESQTRATEDNSEYVVDHTASFFLVGPDGRGLMQYAHGITAEELAEDIQLFIDEQP